MYDRHVKLRVKSENCESSKSQLLKYTITLLSKFKVWEESQTRTWENDEPTSEEEIKIYHTY